MDGPNNAPLGSFWGTPGSSNLSLAKSFTHLDKDRACREGFEYVARYFENSLAELKRRHAGLEVDFHQRDADSFSYAVYFNGSKVGQYGIWHGGRNMGSQSQDKTGWLCYVKNFPLPKILKSVRFI